MNQGPDKWLRLLRGFCPDHLLEEIEGDLLQQFEKDVKWFGTRRAKRRLFWNIIRFVRPGIVMRSKRKKLFDMDLYYTHFKFGFRQLSRTPGFTALHVFGTSIGLAFVLVIFLYLNFQFSYDNFHPGVNNIYRLNLTVNREGKETGHSARTAPALGSLVMSLPAIDVVSRAVLLGEVIASHDNKHIREEKVLLADPDHLLLFQYKLLKGESLTALAEPLSVMLSEQTARKLFADVDPVGKAVEINSENFDGTVAFLVKGVFANQPDNAHLRPEILISYSTLHHFIGNEIDLSWDWQNVYTFIRVNGNEDVEVASQEINDLIHRDQAEASKRNQETWTVDLLPVKDIHTTQGYTGEFEPGVSISNLRLLVTIAIFIVIVVLTNSVNLVVAKSVKRLKEVGVRKVSGAKTFELIVQFLSESFVINSIGIILAFLIVFFGYPYLAGFFSLPIFLGWRLVGVLIAPTLVLLGVSVMLSGFYPAAILSTQQPLNVLRGNAQQIGGAIGARRIFLTIQFAVSIMMIIGSITIWKQLEFMSDQDLGFDVRNKLIIRTARQQDKDSQRQTVLFRNAIRDLPHVNEIASSNEIPGNEIYWRSSDFTRKGIKPGASFSWLRVGDHYFEVLKIHFLAGGAFLPNRDTAEKSIIINKAAAKAFGFTNPELVIGEKLELDNSELEIVGVIEDFHQQGLSKAIDPTIYRYSTDPLNYFVVDVSSQTDWDQRQIATLFSGIFPDSPYEYFVLNDHFDQQYSAEKIFSRVSGMLTMFSVILAGISLIGLSFQSIAQRAKELAVRKVLGAGTFDLMFLLSREYLLLIVISGVISMPLSFIIFSDWLSRFAFHLNWSLSMFLFPLIIMLLIIVLSVGWQIGKAILSNPNDALKYD